MEYVVSCMEKYSKLIIQQKVGWRTRHETAIRKRLYGAQTNDGYGETPADYLKHTSTIEYFDHVNKKMGLLSPSHQSWLISKMDSVCNYLNRFEDSELAKYRVAYSCPPRSSKTLLIYSWIFRLLLEQPHLRIVYVSNNQGNIQRCSSKVRDYLRNIGVLFSADINNKSEWIIEKIPGHTVENIVCGGGLQCYTTLSIPQGCTADILIIDDLYASRADADSTTMREKINESFFANMQTRLTTNGCILVVSTRYHTKDLIGVLTEPDSEHGFNYMNLPAITVKDGYESSYWSKYWSIEKLQRIRKQIGNYNFASLYQGEPITKEESLFPLCARYDQLPVGLPHCYGLDLAYSTKSKNDYTSLVKMYKSKDAWYVSQIWRWKSNITETLKRIKSIVGSDTVRFEFGGTENSIVDIAKKDYNINIKGIRITSDKYSRALPLSNVFNQIYFHSSISAAVLSEIEIFNGDGKGHDDVVDALVNAFNGFGTKNVNTELGIGTPSGALSGLRFNQLLLGNRIDEDDDDD